MKTKLAKRASKRRKSVEHIRNKFHVFNKFVDGVFYPKIHNSFNTQEKRKEYITHLYNEFS